MLGEEMIGYVEVDTNLEEAARVPRREGWADIGNLHVLEPHRRRGVATWLVGHAAEWLRLARVDRVLTYTWLEHEEERAFVASVGFRELTRTQRGWARTP
jgi:GNAT superfamily N-acetyltransferase